MVLRKILAFLFGRLSQSKRLWLIRRLARVPVICDDPRFKVKVAETRDELEQAYILLHDCYVGTKLMEPDPAGMRCNFYTFLPETTTVVVKYNMEIVGTVTLIKDNRLGLPSDKEFGAENSHLRKQGQRLIEVSALAVSKKFRNTNHSVSLMLMKYLYEYAQLVDANCLVCTVHPRTQDFYQAIWGFERRGPVVQYPFVNGALAIHLNLGLTQKMVLLQVAKFGTPNLRKSLPLWVLQEDSRFEYPYRRQGQLLDPVLRPDLLEYFFLKKTDLFASLSVRQKSIFVEIYTHFFGAKAIAKFSSQFTDIVDSTREFRLEVSIPAAVNIDQHFEICKITDISSNGAYVLLPEHLSLNMNDRIEVSFKIGRSSFRVFARVIWVNQGQSEINPYGVGVKFEEPQPRVSQEAKTFIYRKKAA